jgi:RNase adapter protein RapZ
VLFLEADDERWSAGSRRPAAGTRPPRTAGVLEGIRREREQLSELRGLADLIIDTTDLNVHELRDGVVGLVDDPAEPRAAADRRRLLRVQAGHARGTPTCCSTCASCPTPTGSRSCGPYTGRDEPVRDYVFGQPATGAVRRGAERLLDVVVPGYVEEGKRYLTIAIGCTGGKHRSVAIGEHVGRYLRETFDCRSRSAPRPRAE